ncbi:hypothetical protein LTR22_027494 [Elasticomyces elasticus]|nr:hypothetical protein LTR22_027494 [Elasticomyces elasticus]
MSASTIPVFTGSWIDYSHDPILGATLTLTTTNGAFLVSFLTFYVGIAGALSWTIVAYAYHQARANRSEDGEDGLWNQQQAILRNSGSPVKVVWEFLRSWWAWRKVAKSGLRRSMTGVILAILTVAVFSVAGIFAGQVTKSASNDVLIHSTSCGSYLFYDFGTSTLQATLAASQYARNCYGESRADLACGVYSNQTLRYSVDRNATCPFASGTCGISDSASYEMDTGLLDSNDALGLNGPKGERVQYRKVTTCAVINQTESNTGQGTTAIGSAKETAIYLYLGRTVWKI